METYKKVIWGSSIAAGLAVIVIIIVLFLPGKKPGSQDAVSDLEQVEPKPVATPLSKETEDEQPADEPPLDVGLNESDDLVREQLGACSTRPGFEKWLKNGELIRKAVAVTVNIANGESPAAHLHSLLPAGKFKVIETSGKIYLDPNSYKRYDQAAAIFTSLDSAVIVSLYRRAGHLIEEAFKDLGYPDKKFDDVLHRAIDILLTAPIIDREIILKEKVTTYMFVDPRLEKLNPAGKHLLRMGPENIRKIQAKLREIAALLYP